MARKIPMTSTNNLKELANASDKSCGISEPNFLSIFSIVFRSIFAKILKKTMNMNRTMNGIIHCHIFCDSSVCGRFIPIDSKISCIYLYYSLFYFLAR